MTTVDGFKHYLKHYLYILGDNKKKLPYLVFLFCLSSLFDMVGIGLIGPFIKLASEPKLIEQYPIVHSVQNSLHLSSYTHFIIVVGLVIALLFYSKSILGFFIQKRIMNFSFQNKANLINRLMRTYQNLDYAFHVKRNSASLIQRLIENTNTYTEMTLISSLRVVSECLVIVCIFALLAFNSITITLSMLVLLGGLILVYDRLVKQHFHQAGEQLLQSSEDIIKWFNQAIYGYKEIKILSAENYFFDKVKHSGQLYAESAGMAQALQSIPRYLAECAMLSVVVGIIVVTLMAGKSIQDLIPILGMFAIASFRLIPSVNKAATSFTNMRYSAKALEDLYDDLSLMDELADKNSKDKANIEKAPSAIHQFENLSIESLSFKYAADLDWVLNDVSITIQSGDCIGIVGKSGAGKTTLIDVLLGLYQATSGRIAVDGVDIRELAASWSQMIAYLPQNFFLLDDSFEKNITLESQAERVNTQKLVEVLKLTSLEEVVAQLPEGLQTVIGEHGVKLSGGQRQRIALARALYHDREIVIMDEATSALDNETERQIIETISKMKGKKTLILIAHRTSTLAACDKVYEIADAKLKRVEKIELAQPSQSEVKHA